ncbi:MAG: prepilin peptidase [Lachnospiraceae bacterium]|nr:prepilin peptidase [Lachnospiraceae bacterium]
MEWTGWIFVFLFLTRVMITDVKSGVIENKVIIVSSVVFLGVAGLENGIEGLLLGVKMCGITFLVLFFFYLIKGIGAGDVKMISVLAILLQERIWSVLLGGMILTAIYGFAGMIKRAISHEIIYKKGETVPFSVPVGLATVGVLLQECMG